MLNAWEKLSKKLKSHDDDEAEHSRCGGIWHGVSMQRHCEYCMHKDNRDYKNVEQRRDSGCRCGGEFKGVQGGRAQEKKCTVEECCIERIWRKEHKR
jgi:hypothetical protein